jgi:hypothetical protein
VLATLTAAVLVASGCQELQVENLVEPDRERATANSSDVEAFVGGAFHPPFFNAIHRIGQAVNLWPIAGAEFTATMAGGGTLLWYEDIIEPRVQHDNGAVLSLGNGPHGPRNFWSDVTRANSIAYDGLQLMDGGMVITEGGADVTHRVRAFAKLIQGWTWGYLGLVFDEAHVLPESIAMPTTPSGILAVTLESLAPYDEVLEAALGALDEAILIARQHPDVVHFPSFDQSPFWFGTDQPLTNGQFIQMANTLAARLLVLNARTPEERAQVDWNRVLQYTENGLTSDIERRLTTGNRNSTYLSRAQANTSGGTSNFRWDYRTIGPADQSGAYQSWIGSPVTGRNRFDIVTPDRRITGPTPTSDGSYTRYRADNNGFETDRGTYLFSAYQWSRHATSLGLTGNSTGFDQGTVVLVGADENALLRAEAFLRTNNPGAAAAWINQTRTRPQAIGTETYPGLPPVTAAGVPEVDGECVPRLDSGACGDLLTALRYERMIELAGTDIVRGYMDSRGFGTLPDGALLHWPVPGNALDLYGLPNYSFGGVGGPWTATYAPAVLP